MRVYDALELVERDAEDRVVCDALQKVVFTALFLNDLRGCHGVHAHVLVQLLTVCAALCGVHHDVFRRHERQLAAEVLLDDLRVNHKAVRNVHYKVQDRVGRKESFRHADALVRGVVQRALKPLRRSGNRRVQRVYDNVACKGGDTLAAHRVALIRHGGGTDLVLLKRLFHFLQVLQKTDVVREFCGALRDAAQNVQHLAVKLTRVGLAGDGKAALIAHFLGDFRVDLCGHFIVAVEKLKETCLCARGALGAEQLRFAELILHVFKVHQKLLHPQRGALAHGGRLCRLEVGEGERGQVFIFFRKMGKNADDIDELLPNNLHGFRHDDDVGVVADIAACCAEVDDAGSLRALLAVGIHMAHHVVAHKALALFGDFIVDVLGVCLQLIDLFLRDRQTELHFALCKCDPKAAPGLELHVRRKQVLHLFVGIAGGQGGFIRISHVYLFL